MKGPNGRRIRDVWQVNTRSSKDTSGHNAIYPPDLIKPCILFGTSEDDYILDPFMGAGTTAVVAHSLNRRFIGIELNPKYYQLSVDRLYAEGDQVMEIIYE